MEPDDSSLVPKLDADIPVRRSSEAICTSSDVAKVGSTVLVGDKVGLIDALYIVMSSNAKSP